MTRAMLNRIALKEIQEKQMQKLRQKTHRSHELYCKSQKVMPNGVPSAWMATFYSDTKIFISNGSGCYFEDVDGNQYIDMTMCDLSMVCGYGSQAIASAVEQQFRKGSHFLLPVEDSIALCELLAERFRVPFWQFTLSASTANSEAIRIARHFTGRDKILIFKGNYHGHIDELLVSQSRDKVQPDCHGLPKGVTEQTVVIQFNDIDAVEQALKTGEIACVLTEPVMTNLGVIYPKCEFLGSLRKLTHKYNSLLIIDETHTQAALFGGFTRRWNLTPDILTLGKCLGGGIPIGAYGLTTQLKDFVESYTTPLETNTKPLALGGTFYGNAINMASARAALELILTEKNFQKVNALAKQLADGIDEIVSRHSLPWQAFRLGNRSGICLSEEFPCNAQETAHCIDKDLISAARPFMANRGIWEPIYYHGPSVSFAHTSDEIDTYLNVFDAFINNVANDCLLRSKK